MSVTETGEGLFSILGTAVMGISGSVFEFVKETLLLPMSIVQKICF